PLIAGRTGESASPFVRTAQRRQDAALGGRQPNRSRLRRPLRERGLLAPGLAELDRRVPESEDVAVSHAAAPGDALLVDERAVAAQPVVGQHPRVLDTLESRMDAREL